MDIAPTYRGYFCRTMNLFWSQTMFLFAAFCIMKRYIASDLMRTKAADLHIFCVNALPFLFGRNSMKQNKYDFTTGNILKQLFVFSLPLFFSNLLQSFYSIMDLLIVGNVVGSTGVAAISNASMISFVINAICIGLTMGGTVKIAQLKGANNTKLQKETIDTLFVVSTFAAIIITILGLCCFPTIFRLLQIPTSAMQDACDYMLIICCGTSIVFGYNTVCAVMRSFGDSKSPLYVILLATVVNLILDIVFVAFFNLGTKGAAYATVLSQTLAFFSSALVLKKQFSYHFKIKNFTIRWRTCRTILMIGLPSAIQLVVVNLSYLFVTGMLNTYGITIAAASGIGLKVNTFAGMPCWAIGQAITIMVGQNMGAQNITRIQTITRTGLWFNISITLCMILIVQILADPIIHIFLPDQQAVIENGVLYLRICCSINSLFYAAMYTFDSLATGIGAATFAMGNALLDSVVIRLLLSWILGSVVGMGFLGIYIAQALSPLLPAILGLLYVKSRPWEKQTLSVVHDKKNKIC